MIKSCKDPRVKYIYCVQDSSLFPGFYNSVLFNEGLLSDAIDSINDSDNDHDYDLTDVDGYCKAVCKKIVEDDGTEADDTKIELTVYVKLNNDSDRA